MKPTLFRYFKIQTSKGLMSLTWSNPTLHVQVKIVDRALDYSQNSFQETTRVLHVFQVMD